MKMLAPAALFTALTLMVSTGCSQKSDAPPLYQVSGEVKYLGEPVPYGNINFVPDQKQGNSGPQGSAEIVNGKYDTAVAGGRGVVGGAMIAVISGRSKQSPSETEDQGTLFEELQETLTVEQKSSKHDFNLEQAPRKRR